MRRRLSIILLVVVMLLLVPFAIRWLTTYRYFEGQLFCSFFLIDPAHFQQLIASDRAQLCYRQCHTTVWLLFAPVGIAFVIAVLSPLRNRLTRPLLLLGLCAAALSCVVLLFSFVQWNGKKPTLSLSIATVGYISFGNNCLYYDSSGPAGFPMFVFSFVSGNAPIELGFWATSFVRPNRLSLNLPAWMPIWITGLPTLALYLASRRSLSGHCRCGYNLTGNTSGVCPECGNPTKNTHAVSASDNSTA